MKSAAREGDSEHRRRWPSAVRPARAAHRPQRRRARRRPRRSAALDDMLATAGRADGRDAPTHRRSELPQGATSASGLAGAMRATATGGHRPGPVAGVPVLRRARRWFVVAARHHGAGSRRCGRRLPGSRRRPTLVAFAFAVLLYGSVLAARARPCAGRARLRAAGPPDHAAPARRLYRDRAGAADAGTRAARRGRRAALSLALGGLGSLARSGATEGVAGSCCFELAAANLLVGVFNLLPGLPLDGGRVLRAGVWRATGNREHGNGGGRAGGPGAGRPRAARPPLAAVRRRGPRLRRGLVGAARVVHLVRGEPGADRRRRSRTGCPALGLRRLTDALPGHGRRAARPRRCGGLGGRGAAARGRRRRGPADRAGQRGGGDRHAGGASALGPGRPGPAALEPGSSCRRT